MNRTYFCLPVRVPYKMLPLKPGNIRLAEWSFDDGVIGHSTFSLLLSPPIIIKEYRRNSYNTVSTACRQKRHVTHLLYALRFFPIRSVQIRETERRCVKFPARWELQESCTTDTEHCSMLSALYQKAVDNCVRSVDFPETRRSRAASDFGRAERHGARFSAARREDRRSEIALCC